MKICKIILNLNYFKKCNFLIVRGPVFYQMSYLYYSLFACLITFFFGITVSLIVEKMKLVEIKATKPEYLVNWKIWTNNRIVQTEVNDPQELELDEKYNVKF